jgi:hypothetical protein
LSIKELDVLALGSTPTCAFRPEILAPVISASASKVQEEDLIGEYNESSEYKSGEDCETNLAPGILIMITFGVYLIIFSALTLFTKRAGNPTGLEAIDRDFESVPSPTILKSKVMASINSEADPTGRNTSPEGLEFTPNVECVNVSKSGETKFTKMVQPRPKIQAVSESFYKLFKDRHILYRIAKNQSLNEIRYLSFTILSTLILQYTLLGAFYAAFEEPGDASEMYTGIEVIENYSGKELGYVILALAVSLPVSSLMQYKMNSLRGYIMGLIVIAGSLAGSVYMIVECCHRYAGLWTMGCILACAIEFLLGQNICAIIAALVAKFRSH